MNSHRLRPTGVLPAAGRIVRITFCAPNQLRKRKIVTRSRSRATGKYPSWKVERMVEWESSNELNAFRILDCIPKVRTYSEQPCEIVYLDDDGQQVRHYPDIFVLVHGSKELWEIKTEADAKSVWRRTELLTNELASYGFAYRIKIAEHLAQQPRLNIAVTLLRFGRRPVTELERWNIQRVFAKEGTLSWEKASSGAYGPRGREILCRLVLEGILKISLDSAISLFTKFFPGVIEI